MKIAMYAPIVALGALLTFSGCGDSNNNNGGGAEIDGDKLFLFYNQLSQEQMTYDTHARKSDDLNSDPTSNFYMFDKEAGRLLYFPDEYQEGEVDEKVVMLKASYDFAVDGNLTYEDFIYLGHFHDEGLAAHSADEFAPQNMNDAKAAALMRLNRYLAEQEAIEEEIRDAMEAQGETLCNYYVSMHHHEDEHTDENSTEDADEEAAVAHYGLSSTGKVYIFEEQDDALVSIQNPVVLDGASECAADESGITAFGDEGIFVFLKSTQKLYLVDGHGLDYHQHSQWDLDALMPSSFEATQMIGFGEGGHEHDEA